MESRGRGRRAGRAGGVCRAESTTQTFSPSLSLVSVLENRKCGGFQRASYSLVCTAVWLFGWLNGVLQWENEQDSKSLQAERKKKLNNKCSKTPEIAIFVQDFFF